MRRASGRFGAAGRVAERYLSLRKAQSSRVSLHQVSVCPTIGGGVFQAGLSAAGQVAACDLSSLEGARQQGLQRDVS
jgi:hypothetical protein